jgi:eukaryotic-like serine/threonine-protein kinase
MGTVPNVVGMNKANAISALEQAGFRIHWTFECLGSSDIGAVVTQSPGSGASYPAGGTVSIGLQANNCTAPVPNVVGMNKANAISTLEQAGFRISWAFECLGSSDIGSVVTQSPQPGTNYPVGGTVSIQLQASNCS